MAQVCFVGRAMEPGFVTVLTTSGGKQLSLLDSGCNTTVSGFRRDFAEIDWQQPVPIVGVAGTVRANGKIVHAYRAKFKPNNLGLDYGLYMRDLPMGRIIALSAMVARGWRMSWDLRQGCCVENVNGRTTCTVRGNLPYIDFSTKFDPNHLPGSSRKPSGGGSGGAHPAWAYSAAEDADAVLIDEVPEAAPDEQDAGLEPGQPWSMDLSKTPADHEKPELDAPDPKSLEEAMREGVDAAQCEKLGNTHTHGRQHALSHTTRKSTPQGEQKAPTGSSYAQEFRASVTPWYDRHRKGLQRMCNLKRG